MENMLRINAVGIEEIRVFLKKNHKICADYVPANVLLKYIHQAESGTQTFMRPSIVIEHVFCVKQPCQVYKISEYGFSWVELEDKKYGVLYVPKG